MPQGARVLFDFEDRQSFVGAGWEVVGNAWGRRPVSKPLHKQSDVYGYAGFYYANSMHGGDKSTGTLRSPEFDIDGRRLTFRLAGGNKRSELRVELWVDERVVRKASPARSNEEMKEFSWDVSEFSGKQGRIVLVDRHTGGWGHIEVDEFLLWD